MRLVPYDNPSEVSESLSMRMYVHNMLYYTSIKLFGTAEQQEEFVPDVLEHRVLGCFAMTELGHSSSLRDLETVADLDLVHDEWVLNSPTLTSTKWWIGLAGQTATHTIMVAQTRIKGKNFGLAWFIVPLRKDGRLLPGVVCGDIGAKAGRHGLDNGWIQVTNYRIPRKYMLMKWMSVDKQGNVSPPPHPAIMYATLIPERITAISAIRVTLGQAATIACRYGVCRRQGPSDPQIIDFQAQYTSLLPIVAGVYVYKVVEEKTTARWEHLQLLSETDPSEYLLNLADIHCISAGLKAVSSWWGVSSLESCRRSCGGHAFSAYNALAGHIMDWGVMTTGGGDNFPMIQQLAKYVLACVELGYGKENRGSAEFLNNVEVFEKGFSGKVDTMADYIQMYSVLIVLKANTIKSTFTDIKARGLDPWNENMVELIQLGHILANFNEHLKEISSQYGALLPILQKCGLLFAAHLTVPETLQIAMEQGIISAPAARNIRKTETSLSKELRKDVVGLTDAWGFPDFIIKAPIGRGDGDIYRSYFKTVYEAPDCFNVNFAKNRRHISNLKLRQF